MSVKAADSTAYCSDQYCKFRYLLSPHYYSISGETVIKFTKSVTTEISGEHVIFTIL